VDWLLVGGALAIAALQARTENRRNAQNCVRMRGNREDVATEILQPEAADGRAGPDEQGREQRPVERCTKESADHGVSQ